MIHHRSLFEQRIVTYGIELQNLRHLRSSIGVILIPVQLLNSVYLKQSINTAILHSSQPFAPIILQGKIGLNPLGQLLPAILSRLITQSEYALLPCDNQCSVLLDIIGKVFRSARDKIPSHFYNHRTIVAFGQRKHHRIASFPLLSPLNLSSYPKVNILPICNNALIIIICKRFALNHTAILAGQKIITGIGQHCQSAVIQHRHSPYPLIASPILIGHGPFFRSDLFCRISFPLPQVPHKIFFQITNIEILPAAFFP